MRTRFVVIGVSASISFSLQLATFFSLRWPPMNSKNSPEKRILPSSIAVRSKLCRCKRNSRCEQKVCTLFESEFMFVVLKISVLNTYIGTILIRIHGGDGVRWQQCKPSVRTEQLQSISFPCGQCTRRAVTRVSHKSIYGCECEPRPETTQISLHNST